jgi:hypothetical protein
MTPRPRARKLKRSGRRKPGRARAVPAAQALGATATPAPRALSAGRATASRDTPLAVKGPRSLQPGPGGTIRRFVLAGLLLGPGLGIALGPWLASGRLPLFESRISWQGAPPVDADWPRARGPGETAVTRDIGSRTYLIARAPSPSGAEALALELALPRLSRAPELAEARAGRRAEWSAALLEGPRATLTPAGDCAARLRGWADAWRAVATRNAGPTEGAHPVLARHESPVPVESREVTRRALAADPAGLDRMLEREARVARARLFTRIGVLSTPQRVVALDAWRRAWRNRAAEMDSLADALVSRKPRIERELVARVAPAFALDAETRVPDPGVTLLFAAGSEPTAARPMLPTWALFALAGSVLAMALATPLARSAARARRARREALMRRWRVAGEAFATVPPLAPGPVEARLQVVSGSRPRRVARAARELAARFVAGGERVLVIDAGRSLRLHDFFEAQSRLGFQECMREEAPLLGVVQRGGAEGLYVLAHGNPSRLASWEPLGRLLDHAHAHFTRVLLAMDPHVTRQAGEALAGRLMDGWWAAADVTRERDARRFSARLGVALQGLEPAISEHKPLESMVHDFARGAAPPVAAPAVMVAQVEAPDASPETFGPEPASLEGLVEEVVGEAMAESDQATELRKLDELVESDQATELRKLDELVEELARDAARRLAEVDAASAAAEPLPDALVENAPAAEGMAAAEAVQATEDTHAEEMVPAAEAADAVETVHAAEIPATVEPPVSAEVAPEAETRIEETVLEAVGAEQPIAAHEPPQVSSLEQALDLDEALEMAEAELFQAREILEAPETEMHEVAVEQPEMGSDLAPLFVSDEAPGLAPAPALLDLPEPESPVAHDLDASTARDAGTLSAEEPVVLESDPETSERLRFLVWMRRLRDKKRGEVTHAG